MCQIGDTALVVAENNSYAWGFSGVVTYLQLRTIDRDECRQLRYGISGIRDNR
jgi:hypothetical protein